MYLCMCTNVFVLPNLFVSGIIFVYVVRVCVCVDKWNFELSLENKTTTTTTEKCDLFPFHCSFDFANKKNSGVCIERCRTMYA